MAHLVRHLTALVLLVLAGCDGHARVLYLRPPETPKPRWTAGALTIPISGQEDIMRIVSAVAADLGLTRETDPYDLDPAWDAAWSVEHGERPRQRFTLSIQREDAGYWTVGLLDWPVLNRSRYSVNAERAIREALKHASPSVSGRGSAAG